MGTLSELLRKARESSGWSLQTAADILGTTKGHLHAMESGVADNPTLRLIARIVIVYGVRPEAIIASAVSAEWRNRSTEQGETT
jgi:transcriptional regulator with XRE-family HTH domain